MQAESKRIFVPNLPENLAEDDIRDRFAKFGDVTSIEIKQRNEVNAKNYSYKYAFINIDTNHQMLQNCLNDFLNKKWNGNYVEVQLAKESFLERLKKEREDAQNANGKRTSTEHVVERDESISPKKTKVVILQQKQIKKSRDKKQEKEEEEEENSDSSCEVDSDKDIKIKTPVYLDMIVKSNKHRQISNKIEGIGKTPIHVQTNQVKRKSKDPHREKADQKRITSMLKMKQGYLQQKSMIKNALSNIDSQKNNKIVFSDEIVDTEATQSSDKPKVIEKIALFDDDDTPIENNIQLREEFEGKKGKKLFDMQTRFNQDPRFKIDTRFADDATSEPEEESMKYGSDDIEEERAKQMQLLGEVLKQNVHQKSEKPHKSMLRFDPSQPEHSKYEMTAKKSQKRKEKKEEPVEEKLPEVSTETFFKVSENIPFQANENGESFSFLKTFGRTPDEEIIQNGENEAQPEVTQGKKTSSGDNPFRYDSSDEEEEQEIVKDTNEQAAMTGPAKLWTEAFFFKADDYRFQEGSDFVKRMHGQEDDVDFVKVRQGLKKLVKRKIGNFQKKKLVFRKKLGSSAQKRRNRMINAMQQR